MFIMGENYYNHAFPRRDCFIHHYLEQHVMSENFQGLHGVAHYGASLCHCTVTHSYDPGDDSSSSSSSCSSCSSSESSSESSSTEDDDDEDEWDCEYELNIEAIMALRAAKRVLDKKSSTSKEEESSEEESSSSESEDESDSIVSVESEDFGAIQHLNKIEDQKEMLEDLYGIEKYTIERQEDDMALNFHQPTVWPVLPLPL